MIKIELSEKEKEGLREEEITLAIARKLETKLLPLLRRNINFFYAGANIPKKAEAYEKKVNIENLDDIQKDAGRINAVCRPLCDTVVEILRDNGVEADTVSCDTDIFRHTDVLISTKGEDGKTKQYIINYLEDMENIQIDMKTPDFASEAYYNRRYAKFKGGVTTDGKRLDDIAFITEERLEKIDKNIGYKRFGLYFDSVLEQIKIEFMEFRKRKARNEISDAKEKNPNFSEKDAEEIVKKWSEMPETDILEMKLDWIFDNLNQRGSITGHTDFVMYYSRLLLGKVLSEEEYKMISRYDCFVKRENIPEDSKIKDILDLDDPEEKNKIRFCMLGTPNGTYVFSKKPEAYVKLQEEEIEELKKYATISKSARPSDLVLLLADKGNALPLVFNPLGQRILDDRAAMIGEENRENQIKALAKAIECTDGKIQDGGMTSMRIPYPDGSIKLIYIDENNELAEIYNGIKKIYHYNEETEQFSIETVPTQPSTGNKEER